MSIIKVILDYTRYKMRELLEKERKITVIPHDFRNANKGTIKEVTPEGFTVELDYDAIGMLKHNYCEFYTQTKYGTLFFTSYPKEINNRTIRVASPAKHKFLQRRQYTRIKYIYELELIHGGDKYPIKTLDISAGGMKFTTKENINIEYEYDMTLPLSEIQSVKCIFSPIRIEKNNDGSYTLSGRFNYYNNNDKMVLIQYCAKRSIEIRNK